MRAIEIIGTGSCVPHHTITNDELAQSIDTSDAWIYPRTGIHAREFCTARQSTVTMAIEAARKAVDDAGIPVTGIRAVLAATMSPDFSTPSTACFVSEALKLREDTAALDLNAACSGFIYALETARGILSGIQEMEQEDAPLYALVIGAEQLSRLLKLEDRTTSVLFGDGAGAVIVKLTEAGRSDYAVTLGSRGSRDILAPGLYTGAIDKSVDHMVMDGKAVFVFAVEIIPRLIERVLRLSGSDLAQIDYVLCHQANARIIRHVVRKLQVPEAKFPMNMERLGNTSAASIPILLDEMHGNGTLRGGEKLLLAGFGGGLTFGGMQLRFRPEDRT